MRVLACLSLIVVTSGAALADRRESIVYDSFSIDGGSYTLADYNKRWSNPFGLGQMGLGDTRSFAGGHFAISALPFTVASDFSVYDHLKYIAVSTQSFVVPRRGSVTFSSTIMAETPGTQPGRVITGTYLQSGAPYAAATLEGQQAGAVMNMIDFSTGQLFDWFVSGTKAFTLIERLPSNVANGIAPGQPGFVGRDNMYTQIIDEVAIEPGTPQRVAIRYTRTEERSWVEFFLDGRLVSRVANVGVPLDVQGKAFSGTYPSLGRGEPLVHAVNSFSIGHGLFSLLDAFPFQHPDVPELAVSIPIENRLFGQGASARFDRFRVDTVDFDAPN